MAIDINSEPESGGKTVQAMTPYEYGSGDGHRRQLRLRDIARADRLSTPLITRSSIAVRG